jgi:hypothetical protein
VKGHGKPLLSAYAGKREDPSVYLQLRPPTHLLKIVGGGRMVARGLSSTHEC